MGLAGVLGRMYSPLHLIMGRTMYAVTADRRASLWCWVVTDFHRDENKELDHFDFGEIAWL